MVGEISIDVHCDGKSFKLETLVVRDIDVEVLDGALFLKENDIILQPARKEIRLDDETVFYYGQRSPSLRNIPCC